MIFKVQDDGIGMDGARLAQVCAMLRDGEQEPEQEETGGFGLFNVNQRIQLNYGCLLYTSFVQGENYESGRNYTSGVFFRLLSA